MLSASQYEAICSAMGAHVQPDEYGEYTICNVYLDTANDDLIRRSVEKPVFKEKLRVRSYGVACMGRDFFNWFPAVPRYAMYKSNLRCMSR